MNNFGGVLDWLHSNIESQWQKLTALFSMMPSPQIMFRLSAVRTFAEAEAVWADHGAELESELFVLSVREPSEARWPARLDFSSGGHLRSLFAYDKLLFVSKEILRGMNAVGPVTLSLDYTIGFDSNAAQYLRTLVERTGDHLPEIRRFRSTLQHLTDVRMNWELMPFLIEHAEAIRTGRDADYIWRLVRASEYFDRCDRRHFVRTGELRLQATDDEVTAATHKALVDWIHVISNEGIERYRYQHRKIQVLLLKAALIRHKRPAAQYVVRNLAEFIEFMCAEVGSNLPWMVWAASGLFEHGGQFEPLRKLTCKPSRFPSQSRNVAWDIVHYMIRRDLAKPIGRGGSFLVPYTLTFDHGLAAFFDGQPQRSCLLVNPHGFPQFFADRNIEQEVISRFPQLAETTSRHLTLEAHRARVDRIRTSGARDMGPLLAELSDACERA